MLKAPKSFLGMVVLGLAATTGAAAAPRLVTAAIDDAQVVRLAGNTRPEAVARYDRGAVEDGFALQHMQLLLQRPAQTEAALARYIDALHDRASPYYQHWLTAEQLGTQYGPAAEDIAAVTGWLTSHGFTVNAVSQAGMTIDFSGTAGQIREAFHTEIHRLSVNGALHIANMNDPWIPAALRGVVAGVVSLHDFRPNTMYHRRPAYTYGDGLGDTYYNLVPADLATIYNLNPLFAAGITGTGEKIVVIEDTNVYSTHDWSVFRKTFGLAGYTSGTFQQVHPAPKSGTNNCASPGVVANNEVEAELDAEWASAAAPNAAIELASCADTTTTFGGLIALQNIIELTTPPEIVSISYGYCEAENGAAANAAYYAAYQQAVARGISVFVAAGDEGAASCDAGTSNAVHGIGVSGFATTPYNVAVGGTDFGDSYANTNSTYWSSTNTQYYGSALSYVPEIPWNDSCGSVLVSIAVAPEVGADPVPYGTNGVCNNAVAQLIGLTTIAAGSGGPSGCAKGAPAVPGVVGGTCRGWAKPSWQVLVGNPADKVRDIPDVALFASDGSVWLHAYVFCDSDVTDGGTACTGAPSGWVTAGGTSFASPIMAGIQALVDQKLGARQGNPAPVLYKLAAAEYGATGNANCNASIGNGVASTCIFYDITLGDMDVNCSGTIKCFAPGGGYGVLSNKVGSYNKAFGTGVGWDFATGIGSVNAANLVNNW
jgi:subtilase family serine protease